MGVIWLKPDWTLALMGLELAGNQTGCCRGNALKMQATTAASAAATSPAATSAEATSTAAAILTTAPPSPWPCAGQTSNSYPYIPSMEMPSFHQDSIAGGLLELESQMMVASMPGRSSSGSMRIFTVSGATVRRVKGEGRREKNNNNNNGNNSRGLRGGKEKLSTYSAR